MTVLDRNALVKGAWVSLVFAVPFAIGSALVAAADDGSPWTAVLWLGALCGFVVGAGVAAWVQERALPMAHGTVSAGGTYLATQAVFTVIRLARGAEVSWLGIFFTFTTVIFAGVVGGGLGSMLRKRGLVPGQRGAALREDRP